MSPCYADPRPIFQPAMRIIAGITNSFPALVTTTLDHQYLSGLIVRIRVPRGFGMQQINELTGTIVVTGATTFDIDINTIDFDVFTFPPVSPLYTTCAQVVPVGELNETLDSVTRNVLPFR